MTIDVGTGVGTEAVDPGDAGVAATTRERILDIALELFTAQGYDKTSMREIAERLGFSKAAIYYHFASKEDILLALHLRLHEFGRDALRSLEGQTPSLELWARLLDQFIDQMLQHRALFIFHERNQAAIEGLHRERHESDHEDMQLRFREALSNEDLPVGARVKMACAFGGVMGALAISGDAFTGIPSDELGAMLRESVAILLTDAG